MTITYIWRGSAGVGDSSAQEIGERLTHIEQQRGKLHPEDVVDDARSRRSPLHRFFEWDDSEAARAYRLSQAQDLIRKVYVKHVDNQAVPSPIRAFVNIKTEGEERTYESIVSVMSDASKRARLLRQAREELEQWRKRYEHLAEFSRLILEIDQAAA